MKRVVALGLASGVAIIGAAAESSAQAPPTPQPTQHHERLKEDVGEWEASLKMWMPPGDPVESTGSETVSMLGPFWQVAKFEGSFMGQSFTGTGWMGWDAEEEEYVTAWIDTMTPTITYGSATWDPETKSYIGSMTGVGPDGQEQTMETTLAYPEEGKRVFTMKVGGQTTMEITYTRK